MPTTPDQLIGTWRLVSWVRIEDGGARSERLGCSAKGLIKKHHPRRGS